MRTPQNQVLHFININVSTELEIFTNGLKPKTAKNTYLSTTSHCLAFIHPALVSKCFFLVFDNVFLKGSATADIV